MIGHPSLEKHSIVPEGENGDPLMRGFELTCSQLTPELREIFGIPKVIYGDLRVGPTR